MTGCLCCYLEVRIIPWDTALECELILPTNRGPWKWKMLGYCGTWTLNGQQRDPEIKIRSCKVPQWFGKNSGGMARQRPTTVKVNTGHWRQTGQGPATIKWTQVIEDTLGRGQPLWRWTHITEDISHTGYESPRRELISQESFGQAMKKATFCKGLAAGWEKVQMLWVRIASRFV